MRVGRTTRMYTNLLGLEVCRVIFSPTMSSMDDGLNDRDSICCCEQAPRNATIVTETPRRRLDITLRSSAETDLRSGVCSLTRSNSVSETEPAYVILQRGRTYFENQNEMKEVRELRFTLVYAGMCRRPTRRRKFMPYRANPIAAGKSVRRSATIACLRKDLLSLVLLALTIFCAVNFGSHFGPSAGTAQARACRHSGHNRHARPRVFPSTITRISTTTSGITKVATLIKGSSQGRSRSAAGGFRRHDPGNAARIFS